MIYDWMKNAMPSKVSGHSFLVLKNNVTLFLANVFRHKTYFSKVKINKTKLCGPRQANLVLIAYASSEGSGEPAHPRSLARTFAARSYKQWVKRHLQTESQIPGPSEWLGMRSYNLSWRNARRHKFAWRGSYNEVFKWVIACRYLFYTKLYKYSSRKISIWKSNVILMSTLTKDNMNIRHNLTG